ncbi:MAG TPA: DUF177 domain-containing protein [Bacteroidetes bacterium]|nr:DUF177 domain-containing protein [Bacteroidota bacterium]
MNVLDQFSIPVSGLRNGLHGYDFDIGDEFFRAFEKSSVRQGSVQVHLAFEKREDMYLLTFTLSGKVTATCDRCLDDFALPIEDIRHLLVKFDVEPWEDADVVFIEKGTISLNVASYIYEFIHLAMPMIKTHENAGDDCNPEMLKYLDRTDGGQGQAGSPGHNPFPDAFRDIDFEN